MLSRRSLLGRASAGAAALLMPRAAIALADNAPDVEVLRTSLYEKSLRDFVRGAWHVVEPTTPFVPGWHLDAITEHLEAVTAGDIRNLLINIPPRHAKSLCVSVFWMTWSWIAKPETRWLFASYAASLSVRDSLKCRRIVESPWFRARWGDRFALTGDQNAKVRFENDKTGYRIATSVGGAATGEGGDVVVVDDPHSVKEKESQAKVEATLGWWDEVMSTRLNDPKKGAKVIVMQRVADKDLSGHVLKQGGYEHLCLPAEYEPKRRCVTSLGWEDPRKEDGELLWPERVGPKEIADFKVRLGPGGYAGQFQQRPNPAGGGRFKEAWFRSFRTSGDDYHLLNPAGQVVKTVAAAACDRFGMMDPAGTEKDQDNRPCYTVIGVYDVTPDGDMLRVGHWRDQVEAPAAADKGVEVCREFDLPWIGVEKNGIGLGVVQTIRRKGVTVKPILARGSKEARTETAEIRMAAGMIYTPEGANWVWDWRQELTSFPRGEFADQVDELAHAAIHVQRTKGAPVSAADEEHAASRDEAAARQEESDLREHRAAAYDPRGAWIGYDEDDD